MCQLGEGDISGKRGLELSWPCGVFPLVTHVRAIS